MRLFDQPYDYINLLLNGDQIFTLLFDFKDQTHKL